MNSNAAFTSRLEGLGTFQRPGVLTVISHFVLPRCRTRQKHVLFQDGPLIANGRCSARGQTPASDPRPLCARGLGESGQGGPGAGIQHLRTSVASPIPRTDKACTIRWRPRHGRLVLQLARLLTNDVAWKCVQRQTARGAKLSARILSQTKVRPCSHSSREDGPCVGQGTGPWIGQWREGWGAHLNSRGPCNKIRLGSRRLEGDDQTQAKGPRALLSSPL